MEIIKDILSKRLARKLPNGLIEIKEFYDNGQLLEHSFYKNGKKHGECKWYMIYGSLFLYELYENGKLIKDLLDENN